MGNSYDDLPLLKSAQRAILGGKWIYLCARLALYINSREVVALYRYPALLWLIGPCLLYWVTRIWFIANRGEMDDDPVVFALRAGQVMWWG